MGTNKQRPGGDKRKRKKAAKKVVIQPDAFAAMMAHAEGGQVLPLGFQRHGPVPPGPVPPRPSGDARLRLAAQYDISEGNTLVPTNDEVWDSFGYHKRRIKYGEYTLEEFERFARDWHAAVRRPSDAEVLEEVLKLLGPATGPTAATE